MRSRSPRHRIVFAAVALSCLTAVALPVAAQTTDGTRTLLPDAAAPSASAGEYITAFTVNVAIGGLTAGIRQWRKDGSFLDGLWRGGLGGAGTFAGKLLAASDAPAGGLTGRAIAGAGSSVSRNAADGRPLFHRIVLPVGPVRLHWQPAARRVHASFDAAGFAAFTGSYLTDIGASLDLKRSLASGTPVLMARNWETGWGWHGRHVAGTILLRGDQPHSLDHDRFLKLALAHERVHVLQYDQAYILWSEPVERQVLHRLGAPPLLVRSLDLSLHSAALLGLNLIIPYEDRPWEKEADLLSGTSRFQQKHADPTLFRQP